MHNRTLRRIFGDEEPPEELQESQKSGGAHAKQNKVQRLGRPKGSPNRITREFRLFARSVLGDPQYRENFFHRARTGTLAPPLELFLWQTFLGKPAEFLKLEATLTNERSSFDSMTDEELIERTEDLLSQIREVKRLTASPEILEGASELVDADSNSFVENEFCEAAESPVITPPPSDDPVDQ